jgi:ADP-ribose pyrophosphatase YjhB (NUDIX family)
MRKLLGWLWQPIGYAVGIYWRITKPKTFGSRIILRSGDDVLLVRHLGGKLWAFPGGGKKKNETFEQCVVREIREELYVAVPEEKLKLLGTYVSTFEGKHDTIHIFSAEIEKFDPKKLSWELSEARWFPIDNPPQWASYRTVARLEELKAGKSNLEGEW